MLRGVADPHRDQTIDGRIHLGAIEEDDYRGQLAELRAQLAISEHLPDERRILEATATAQDIPRAWVLATPEQRRRIVWSTFALIRVGDGRVTAVRPRPETAPLFAGALTAQQRSRPGLNPPVFAAGITVEGLEELREMFGAVALVEPPDR